MVHYTWEMGGQHTLCIYTLIMTSLQHEDLSKQVLQRIYDREKRWFDDDSFTQSDIDVVKRMIHHKAEDIKEVL